MVNSMLLAAMCGTAGRCVFLGEVAHGCGQGVLLGLTPIQTTFVLHDPGPLVEVLAPFLGPS